jgi:hypothetical protein
MLKNIASHFKTLSFSLVIFASTERVSAATTGPVEPWPNGEFTGQPQSADTGARKPAKIKTVREEAVQPAMAEPSTADQITSMLQQMLSGGMMGGPGMNGDMGDFGGNQYSNEQFPGMSQIPGSGKMEHCGNTNGPTQVQSALREAKEFLNKCSLARRGNNQKIAINDYSGGSTPMMYIFDLDGNCLGRTAVSYGNGAGKVKPQPCSDNGAHLTPAGFHLTSTHNGAKYSGDRAIGLIGLEGQNSVARGVIIHPAKSPGTASSWGCSGVGYEAFNAVKSTLGEGSLVYNFFGQATGPSSCRNNPGLTGQHNFCRMDRGGNPVPSLSNAGGAPALVESAN